jgi:hypothetical protein
MLGGYGAKSTSYGLRPMVRLYIERFQFVGGDPGDGRRRSTGYSIGHVAHLDTSKTTETRRVTTALYQVSNN